MENLGRDFRRALSLTQTSGRIPEHKIRVGKRTSREITLFVGRILERPTVLLLEAVRRGLLVGLGLKKDGEIIVDNVRSKRSLREGLTVRKPRRIMII